MIRLPKQAPLPLERKDKVMVRQMRERAAGKKVNPGPGRPKKKGSISHRRRPTLSVKSSLHITLKLKRGIPRLRGRKPFNAIAAAFRKYAKGDGFRLVHFSVQHDHIHLLIEADSKPKLSRGMQKLGISIARRLNFLRGAVGRLFRERYNAHVLKTPQEAKNALVYVMHNGVKHQEIESGICDPMSSAAFFEGYTHPPRITSPPLAKADTIAEATSWLLTIGWKRRGPIRPNEVPRVVS